MTFIVFLLTPIVNPVSANAVHAITTFHFLKLHGLTCIWIERYPLDVHRNQIFFQFLREPSISQSESFHGQTDHRHGQLSIALLLEIVGINLQSDGVLHHKKTPDISWN